MEKITEKEWAKLMLEMDLKTQSGSIWTDEKSGLQKENKITNYQILDFKPHILKPDPIYYNGKIVDSFPPQIID